MSALAIDNGRPGAGLPFRNFGLSLGGRGVSLSAHVISLMVVVRLFTKDEVAVIAFAGVITMLMDTCKGLGLGTLLLKRLPQLADGAGPEARALLGTYLLYSLLVPSFLTAMSLAAPKALVALAGLPGSGRALQTCLLIGLFTVLSNTNLLVLQASEQFGRLAAYTLVTSLLQRLAPCLGALWLGAGLEQFLIWSLVATAVGFAATCVPLFSMLRPLSTQLLNWRDFWPESRHFYGSSLLRYATTQVDQLFVALLFPPATLAVYFVLRRLFSLVIVAITSLIDALVPDLSRRAAEDADAARGRLTELARFSLFAGSAGAALMAGNGSAIVEMLLGPGYGEDPLLIALFAATTSLYFLYCFVQLDLMLFQAPRTVLWMAAATSAANLVAGPLTHRWLGVHSLPMAMLAGYLLGLLAARRRSPARETIWRYRELFAGLAVVTLASLAPVVAQTSQLGEWGRTAAVNLAIAVLVTAYFWRHRVAETLRRLGQGPV